MLKKMKLHQEPQTIAEPALVPSADAATIEVMQKRQAQLQNLITNPNLSEDSKSEIKSELSIIKETLKKIVPKKIADPSKDNLSLNHNLKKHKDYDKWFSIFKDEEFIELIDLLSRMAIKDEYQAINIISDAYEIDLLYRFGNPLPDTTIEQIERKEWEQTPEYQAQYKRHLEYFINGGPVRKQAMKNEFEEAYEDA
jgi:hypothetical protein